MSDASARFSYQGLDRVIHEKARLGILTSLMTNPTGLSFAELKHLCNLTDGNLSRHLKMLEEAGLISTRKDHSGQGRAMTYCSITPLGHEKFAAYLAVLEQVIHDASSLPVGQLKPN